MQSIVARNEHGEEREFQCSRCGCRWFRTPDTQRLGPDGIVQCKGCGHRQTRSEAGMYHDGTGRVNITVSVP